MNNADLSGADLSNSYFYGTPLTKTIWHNANLTLSSIILMNYLDADFSGADLRKAYFTKTYMNKTDFSGADLREAVLENCAFENIDFSGANLQGIKYDSTAVRFFAACNLDGANISADLQNDLDKVRSEQKT